MDMKTPCAPRAKNHRKKALLLALMAAAAAAGAQDAASGFPAKPVTLVVPFVPGGGTDTGARLIAQKLGDKWGKSVVVDNRGGAGGTIGSDLVARARPDGYTLLMANVGTQAINPYLYKKMPYDSLKAFAPISMVAELPLVLVVNPAFEAQSIQRVVELGRQKPDALSYASSGVGNSTHLAMEVLQAASGARYQHIAYKGGGQANADVIAGHVPMQFTSVFGATGLIAGKKFVPLAVSSAQRVPALPSVPTMEESGIHGANFASWIGVMAPAGTPDAIVRKIARDIADVVSQPDVRKSFIDQGAVPRSSTPEEFAKTIGSDMQRMQKLIVDLKLQLE